MRIERPRRYACSAAACASLLAALSAPGLAGARPGVTPVLGAEPGVTTVNEYGSLQKQNSQGYTVEEKGVGWGTFNCSVLMQMTLTGTLVNATYTAYLQGGTIGGTATAHIHSASKTAAYFSGTISLSHGTGSRAGAAGTASFSGTINRSTYAVSIHVAGRVRL